MHHLAAPARVPSVNPPVSAHLQSRIDREFWTRWNGPWGGRSLLHGQDAGPGAVRLDGNDYLALTGHPDIVRAQIQAIRTDAGQVIQSSVFLLDAHPARRLERKLAALVGKEDGLICQSGYTANLGLLQAIADEHTVIHMDSLAHTSLWEGARRAGARVFAFRHNDPEHLRRQVGRHGAGIVVVDAVYSTTGALCPLGEMVDVAEAAGCMLLVDESHSLGTHGPEGSGLCVALGLSHRIHFITASLAKAFAGRAGFMSLPADMRNYVLSSSYPNMFSSCLLPHEIAGLDATLDLIRRSDAGRDRLRDCTGRVRGFLAAQGYPVHQGTEQIIALEAGSEPDTMVLRDALEARGIFGSVFCAPATSRNRTMVRLTLHAALTDAELHHLEAVTAEVAGHLRPWDWPLARRGRNGAGAQVS
ncbi:MAG: alpha-hydroxyketone-type quorum-sensing autoinducer synthase [Burkholderiaceae bacterium]